MATSQKQETFQLTEIYDRQKLLELINHGMLSETIDEKDRKYKKLSDKQQIQWIYDNLDDKSSLKVKYNRMNRVGRYYIHSKACYTLLRRIYRNYLCDGLCYDFDMKNSYLSILCELIEKYNLVGCENIKSFYKNCESRKNAIINLFNFKTDAKKQYKKMMLSIAYGSGYDGKFKSLMEKYEISNSVVSNNAPICNFLKNYIEEFKNLTQQLQQIQELNDYAINTSHKKDNNEEGSWLSYLIQTIECEIVVGLKNYLQKKYSGIVLSYEYDGLKLSKAVVDKYGLGKIEEQIDRYLKENNHNLISIVNKPMDEKVKIQNVKKIEYYEECEEFEEHKEHKECDMEDLYVNPNEEDEDEDMIFEVVNTKPTNICIEQPLNKIDVDIENKLQEIKNKQQQIDDIELIDTKDFGKTALNEHKTILRQTKFEMRDLNNDLKELNKLKKEQIKISKLKEIEKQKNEKEQIKLDKLNEIEKEMNECRIANSDIEAAEMIYEEIKDNIKYAEGLLYFREENNVWVHKFDKIKSSVIKHIMNSNIKKKNGDNIVQYAQNYRPALNIAETVFNEVKKKNDTRWYQNIFNSSLGKILFNNGYWDFQLCKFIETSSDEYDRSIVFLEIIDRDYILLNYDEKIKLEEYKTKIFYTSFSKNVGDYYLLQLSRALAGDCMKRMLFGIGPGNTGKSIIGATIKHAFTDYVGNFNSECLMYNNSSNDPASKLRWLMLLRSKRIIYSSEMKMGVKIDGNLLKSMSNGGLDTLSGRTHGGEETDFKLSLLAIIFANDMEGITPVDDAIVNRIRAIPYEKVFVDKPECELNEFELLKDEKYEKIHTNDLYQRCFIQMVFDCYTEYVKGEKKEIEPDEIAKANIVIIGSENGSIINKFLNDYELTNDETDYVESKQIEGWIKMNSEKVSMTKFGLEMKKYATIKKLNNVTNKAKKIGGKSKVCWFGIKERIEEFPTTQTK